MAIVFFSYSHIDEALRDKLEEHLALMKHQGLIEAWHDRRILAGSNIDDSINENLERADVILLLVSSSFIASTYCYSREMKRALERHKEGTARVVPVILRPCDWHSAPFGSLLAAPKDGKAVTSWPDQDEVFTDVARQVRQAITAVPKTSSPNPSTSSRGASPTGIVSPFSVENSVSGPIGPRSSNLRLKKEFTDYDRDEFLRDSFDFMARYFETSLEELSARNPGIKGKYHRIDANQFTAVVYQDGKSIADCTIRIDGFGSRSNSIAFAYGTSVPRGTSNEMVHVESDSQLMYLKPLGMQSFGGQQGQKLSQEGASEHFWDLLIKRLQ
ncbi:toll/interleukin-1 receptor domain-containing protein [Noviherbaspirillum sp. Root189]|uniref:toll/interleukin-1 receptor domain-containing protein n=1 Tax=Noviherbaspirillum sp. Root189 TaxID=1736487 RepID=UPI00070EA223|nr:toll/interleukin-1 receptor domain-containing protein [Noviherbaspirillum sp. Root189]KRB79508.1 hypothetical protein ASE07_25205 [Noviherbaspirillum sp. Root189]